MPLTDAIVDRQATGSRYNATIKQALALQAEALAAGYVPAAILCDAQGTEFFFVPLKQGQDNGEAIDVDPAQDLQGVDQDTPLFLEIWLDKEGDATVDNYYNVGSMLYERAKYGATLQQMFS